MQYVISVTGIIIMILLFFIFSITLLILFCKLCKFNKDIEEAWDSKYLNEEENKDDEIRNWIGWKINEIFR